MAQGLLEQPAARGLLLLLLISRAYNSRPTLKAMPQGRTNVTAATRKDLTTIYRPRFD